MVVLQEIASLSTLHHDNGRHLDVDCTACSLGCRHFDTSTTATYVQTVFKISSSVRPHVFTPSKMPPVAGVSFRQMSPSPSLPAISSLPCSSRSFWHSYNRILRTDGFCEKRIDSCPSSQYFWYHTPRVRACRGVVLAGSKCRKEGSRAEEK